MSRDIPSSSDWTPPLVQPTFNPHFPSLQDLPPEVIRLIRSSSTRVEESIRKRWWDNSTIPTLSFLQRDGSEAMPLIETLRKLRDLSYHTSEWIRIHQPNDTFQLLNKLHAHFLKLHDPRLSWSPYYLRFLAELISAAELSTEYKDGEHIAEELEWLIQIHLAKIFSSHAWDSSNITSIWEWAISPKSIARYRHTLLNAVVNLGGFYARIGKDADRIRMTLLAKGLAKQFCSAQIAYDTLLLNIRAWLNYDNWGWEVGQAFSEARLCLVTLARIYKELELQRWAQENALKRWAQESAKLRILEIYYQAQALMKNDTPSVVTIAQILTERNQLLREEDLWVDDIQWLIEVEIFLYIAIDRLMSNATRLTQAIQQHPAAALVMFQWAVNKVNTRWLDVNAYLKQDNAWLFVWSLIHLFSHRVQTSNGSISADAGLQKDLIQQMVLIYDISVGGSDEYNITVFKRQPWFPIYIDNCRLLLNKLWPGEYTEADILDWVRDYLTGWEVNGIGEQISWKLWPIPQEGIERDARALFAWVDEGPPKEVSTVGIDHLTVEFMKQCTDVPWIITFPMGESAHHMSVIATSTRDVWRQTYTLRFWLARNSRDRFAEFLWLAHVIIDSDGYIHTQTLILKVADPDFIFKGHFQRVLKQIKGWWCISNDVDAILESRTIYWDAFWEIYANGQNKKWHYVFVVETHKGSNWKFRCEINTYQAWGKNHIYVGAMCNSQWWHDLNEILGWLWGILSSCVTPANEQEIRETVIAFFRDSKHWERAGWLTIGRFLRSLPVTSGINTQYIHSFWSKFMHPDDPYYEIKTNAENVYLTIKKLPKKIGNFIAKLMKRISS